MLARGNMENVMIISADDGALWATSSDENFFLREYKVVAEYLFNSRINFYIFGLFAFN